MREHGIGLILEFCFSIFLNYFRNYCVEKFGKMFEENYFGIIEVKTRRKIEKIKEN